MDSNAEDIELIESVLNGDSPMFALLVNRYERAVFATTHAMLGNRHDAEDVTQEVFVSAFRKLHSFERRSSFLTWLRRISFHLVIDHQRKRKARIQPTSHADESLLEGAGNRAPIETLAHEELIHAIRLAIQSQPEEQRNIITLRDIDGLDYAEIASILDVPLGTVRSRLHRARLELRETMERMGLQHALLNQDSVPVTTPKGRT